MSDPFDYDDEPFICPRSGEHCVRAFCEDYGCADAAGVPLDANDFAAGSLDPNELMPPLPTPRRKRPAALDPVDTAPMEKVEGRE